MIGEISSKIYTIEKKQVRSFSVTCAVEKKGERK
jgi:hypothetical protein